MELDRRDLAQRRNYFATGIPHLERDTSRSSSMYSFESRKGGCYSKKILVANILLTRCLVRQQRGRDAEPSVNSRLNAATDDEILMAANSSGGPNRRGRRYIAAIHQRGAGGIPRFPPTRSLVRSESPPKRQRTEAETPALVQLGSQHIAPLGLPTPRSRSSSAAVIDLTTPTRPYVQCFALRKPS